MSQVFPYKSDIVITTFPLQADALATEVRNLGYAVQHQSMTEVEINGHFDECLRLNMYLRTAGRVLWQIQRFRANTANDLYKRVKAIEWENFIPIDGYFTITSYVRNEFIKDDRFANVRVKDAIADRFMEKFGKRPDSGPGRDQVVIHLYWLEEKVRIYFDTSGNTIAKHGYRKIPFKAPMIESLASSTIIASGWDMRSHFINPMCGSGTLAIEAAMMATNTAPGMYREHFGFMFLKGYDEESWENYYRLASMQAKESLDFKIIATDISKKALFAAKENAKLAQVDHLIEFHQCDFQETPIPDEPGVVFINPEYGERLGEEQILEGTYKQIGDFLKQKCQGYDGYIFTGNMNLAKFIGLRTSMRIPFMNAKIECRLLKYEMYRGTKKTKA